MTGTRGEGVKKSKNVADVIYGSPLTGFDIPLGPRRRVLRFPSSNRGRHHPRPGRAQEGWQVQVSVLSVII